MPERANRKITYANKEDLINSILPSRPGRGFYNTKREDDMSYFDAVYADHELSPRSKTVCMYLRDRANKEGENWYAIGTIASAFGLSRSTVNRALGNLVCQGRVEKEPRYRKNGGCTSNIYRLL